MTKVCRHCAEEFELMPEKPGFADECPDCLDKFKVKDVPKLKAVVECPKRGAPSIRVIDKGEVIDKELANKERLGYLGNTVRPRLKIIERKRDKGEWRVD